MSKDSHIFWHVVKTCPTPGGHHEGAALLQASFLSSVSEGEETATLQQFLGSCGTIKVLRCLRRKGFGFHMGWVQEGPQSNIIQGDNHHLSWISPVHQLGRGYTPPHPTLVSPWDSELVVYALFCCSEAPQQQSPEHFAQGQSRLTFGPHYQP